MTPFVLAGLCCHTGVALLCCRDSLAAEIGAVYTGYYASVSEGAPVYMGQIMGTITQRLSKYGICLRGDISACLLTISVRPTAPHLLALG